MKCASLAGECTMFPIRFCNQTRLMHYRLIAAAVCQTRSLGRLYIAQSTFHPLKRASMLLLACMLHKTSPRKKRSLSRGIGMTIILYTFFPNFFSNPIFARAYRYQSTHNSLLESAALSFLFHLAPVRSAKAARCLGCTAWPVVPSPHL